MKLNEIRNNDGATHAKKRRGRGIGSGLGKTGGRGHKGQKSRSGVAMATFEGGQQPIYRRLPMRGFKNPNRANYSEISIERLQAAIDAGRVDAKAPVNAEVLVAAGVLRRAKDGLRLLGGGELKAKLDITVAGATRPAIAAVEKAGGTITLTVIKKDKNETVAGNDG